MLWLALWASSNYDVLSLKIILTGPPNVHVLWYVCYFEFAQNLTQEASFGYQANDRENPSAWLEHPFFALDAECWNNRVCKGHGTPEKSWNFKISFSRPRIYWNWSVGHGKLIYRYFLRINRQKDQKLKKKHPWVRKPDQITVKIYTRTHSVRRNIGKKALNSRFLEQLLSILYIIGNLKGHGKSWNFKSSTKYKPWITFNWNHPYRFM